MREEGIPVWYSIDTGPSVFANTFLDYIETVAERLSELGSFSVITSKVGDKPFLSTRHLFWMAYTHDIRGCCQILLSIRALARAGIYHKACDSEEKRARGISTTFTSAWFNISLAAFLASLFVVNFPFSSIHGRVSSILTHTLYNSFTMTEKQKRIRTHKTIMNFRYHRHLETYLWSFV